jgi:hypothetical protein
MYRFVLNRLRRLAVTLPLLGLVLFSFSCADGRKPVYPVRGQVLDSKGKPAAGALVVFHPLDTDDVNKPVAHVDDKGTFTLTTYSEGDGAPAGKYAITLEWPVPRKTPFDKEGPDRLGGRFGNPKTSPLHFTVEPRQDNEVPVIRLQ